MKLGFLTVAFENLELKEFSDKIVHTHAKDTEILSEGLYENGIYGSVFQDGKKWWRYRVPGFGEIDWQTFVSVLLVLTGL